MSTTSSCHVHCVALAPRTATAALDAGGMPRLQSAVGRLRYEAAGAELARCFAIISSCSSAEAHRLIGRFMGPGLGQAACLEPGSHCGCAAPAAECRPGYTGAACDQCSAGYGPFGIFPALEPPQNPDCSACAVGFIGLGCETCHKCNYTCHPDCSKCPRGSAASYDKVCRKCGPSDIDCVCGPTRTWSNATKSCGGLRRCKSPPCSPARWRPSD